MKGELMWLSLFYIFYTELIAERLLATKYECHSCESRNLRRGKTKISDWPVIHCLRWENK